MFDIDSTHDAEFFGSILPPWRGPELTFRPFFLDTDPLYPIPPVETPGLSHDNV